VQPLVLGTTDHRRGRTLEDRLQRVVGVVVRAVGGWAGLRSRRFGPLADGRCSPSLTWLRGDRVRLRGRDRPGFGRSPVDQWGASRAVDRLPPTPRPGVDTRRALTPGTELSAQLPRGGNLTTRTCARAPVAGTLRRRESPIGRPSTRTPGQRASAATTYAEES
jgi:hypothetical protein